MLGVSFKRKSTAEKSGEKDKTIQQMLITGCPRSGTGYMAKLLTYAGIPCGHEQKYWIYKNKRMMSEVRDPQAESSWQAIPHLHKHKQIIHIVRDPLKVISSMLNVEFLKEGKEDLEFIAQTLPDIIKLQGIERYAYFWTEWNSLIEKHTKNRYRIEDIDDNPQQFLEQFIEPRKIYTNDHFNTWGKYDLKTLDDIPKGKIKTRFIKKMKEYGY